MKKLWIARDKDGSLWIFTHKPYFRIRSGTYETKLGGAIQLNTKAFPEVTHENSPRQVELSLSGQIKPPTEIEDFYNTLKSDPAKIVEWAESEIKAYNELIKLLKPCEK